MKNDLLKMNVRETIFSKMSKSFLKLSKKNRHAKRDSDSNNSDREKIEKIINEFY